MNEEKTKSRKNEWQVMICWQVKLNKLIMTKHHEIKRHTAEKIWNFFASFFTEQEDYNQFDMLAN